jgi:hypothetical protein
MYYNFCRIHKTLRVTPAMEAKIADHVWEISEIVALMDAGRVSRASERKDQSDWYGPAR